MSEKLLFSKGNLKLPKDTYILNICSATDCPSRALGLCAHSKICYALKAERCYKQPLVFRRRQEQQFDTLTAFQIAEALLESGKRSRIGFKALRFSEAGDFRSQADVDKMTEICTILRRAGISCYGYTARSDLNMLALMEVATVQGSGFMLSNNFKVINKGDTWVPDFICPGDCSICMACQVRTEIIIGVPAH